MHFLWVDDGIRNRRTAANSAHNRDLPRIPRMRKAAATVASLILIYVVLYYALVVPIPTPSITNVDGMSVWIPLHHHHEYRIGGKIAETAFWPIYAIDSCILRRSYWANWP